MKISGPTFRKGFLMIKEAQENVCSDPTQILTVELPCRMVELKEGNEEIFSRLMSDEELRKMASEHLLNKVYRTIKNEKA
jgi:hypothetical protein